MKTSASPFVLPVRPATTAGSTLAATMMVVAAIVSFLSIAALITSQFGRYTARQQGVSDEATCCDAALEYAYAQWKIAATPVILNGKPGPAVQDCTPNSGTSPATENVMMTAFNQMYGAFANSGVTCDQLSIEACDLNGNVLVPPQPNASGSKIDYTDKPVGLGNQSVAGYPGWHGTTYNYKATAKVSYNQANQASASLLRPHMGINSAGKDNNGKNVYDTSMTAVRYFQVTSLPLFQAAIFYENKLEIHPGSVMTVTGLVHSNGDLWAQGFDKLQFNKNVSYVGSFHQDADSSVYYGWDGYFQKYFPPDSQQVTWANGNTYANPVGSTSQLNQVSTIDPFGGAIQTGNGLRQIIEVPTAATSGIDPQQIAYNNATVRITVNTSLANTDPSRIVITDNTGAALPLATDAVVRLALGGSTPSTSTITDMREGTSNVKLTNLDMGILSTAVGGLVYIHDVAPTTSSTRTGIRLKNGGRLGTDISVASDGGVYIQGDFNTGNPNGGNGSIVPSNNTSDPNYAAGTGSPQTADYTRHSTAVMADAVTILSNNWQDGNSGNTLAGVYGGSTTTGREATPTTVNTAILAGDVPSNTYAGIASGGAHNFPRFLENWTGKNFTYYGSLVEAFKSEKYTGYWQTGNVYTWPNRMWNYDTNFDTHPPPGVISGIKFMRGRWQRTN